MDLVFPANPAATDHVSEDFPMIFKFAPILYV